MRAAIVIAVKKAGNLPELQAAHHGAEMVAQWATDKGFDSVISIKDEPGQPVTSLQIFDAVKGLVATNSYEQLFIYFSGHGVNLGYCEYWLLSRSDEHPGEAVNLNATVKLAQRCGIPHVVIISDACRTAPIGIPAQRVTGNPIFPSLATLGTNRAVDVFYASLLGEPALEIQDLNVATTRYDSLYTAEVVAALKGERDSALVPGTDSQRYLRPHPLKRYLTDALPLLVAQRLGLTATQTQIPDADILSDENAYLQVFPSSGLESFAGGDELPETGTERVSNLIRSILEAPPGTGAAVAEANFNSGLESTNPDPMAAAIQSESDSFEPMHYETNCGFKVSGAVIKAVHAPPGLQVELLASRDAVRVYPGSDAMANVLLEFEDGRGVVIPAIRDYIAALSFEEERLIKISYEPSDRSSLWGEYSQVRDELVTLRALISSYTRQGVFRLDSSDAAKLTERIRYHKVLDPSLAIYAAYSYSRLGRADLIREMENYLAADLQASLYDISLLAEQERFPRFPFFPMLVQGWSLLDAFGARTPLLDELQPHVATDSPWTIFNPPALPILKNQLKI